MELKAALKCKRFDALSPCKPEAWREDLHSAGLQAKYSSIPDGLQFGFDITEHSTEFNTII